MSPRKRRLPHLLCGASASLWPRAVWHYGGIRPASWLRGLGISAATLLTTPLRWLEALRYNGQVARVELETPPVFIIGHWQAGHSPVHYLLASDPRFAYLNLLQTVFPRGFLHAQPLLKRLLKKKLPTDRAADSLPTGLQAPQGDDMALVNLGLFSFYYTYVFPRRAEQAFREGVLLEGAGPGELARWRAGYEYLIRKVAFAQGKKRIVLRNASNTGRIPQVLEMFPDAKFIHVYRDPYTIYSALRDRWAGLLGLWALQDYDLDRMQQHTLDFFELLMRKYLEDAPRIPPGQLTEIRYETFQQQPLAELERVYRELNLPDFEPARPALTGALATLTGELAGDRELTPAEIQRVTDRWGFALDHWNYPRRETPAPVRHPS